MKKKEGMGSETQEKIEKEEHSRQHNLPNLLDLSAFGKKREKTAASLERSRSQ